MSAPPSPSQTAVFQAAEKAASGELFIVLNPGSGKDEASHKHDAIENVLREAGRPYRFVPFDEGGVLAACELAGQLAARHGGVLVAVGGDGTINAGAQAALRHACPLGVIAQGTFNLFARDHGLPLDAAEAARALLTARPEPVQVGLVNERVFLANAAVGLYPKLLEDRELAKHQLGVRRRWIAVVAGLVTLFEWRWLLTLDGELDGEPTQLRTPSLFVCNNRIQLDRVVLDDDVVEQIGHGRMAALLAHPLGAWSKLKLLGLALVGRLDQAREVDCFPLRSLTVTTRSARKLKVATDGEVQWMQLPLRFTVSPQALWLMVPPKAKEGDA